MIRARAALGFSLLVTLVAGSAAAQSAAQSRPGIAVFPLEFGGTLGNRVEGFDRLSIGLQQMLLNHFAQNPGVRIVERSHLNRIMDEQKLARDSMVDTNTAARLGKLVGARYMVMGGYAELPDLELSARIVDTETSEVIYSRRVSGKRDKVMNMLTDLGNQLEQGFRGLPALPAGVREARQEVGRLARRRRIDLRNGHDGGRARTRRTVRSTCTSRSRVVSPTIRPSRKRSSN